MNLQKRAALGDPKEGWEVSTKFVDWVIMMAGFGLVGAAGFAPDAVADKLGRALPFLSAGAPIALTMGAGCAVFLAGFARLVYGETRSSSPRKKPAEEPAQSVAASQQKPAAKPSSATSGGGSAPVVRTKPDGRKKSGAAAAAARDRKDKSGRAAAARAATIKARQLGRRTSHG